MPASTARFHDITSDDGPVWLLASSLKTGEIYAANKACRSGFGLVDGALPKPGEPDLWAVQADREHFISRLLGQGEATGTAEFRNAAGQRFLAAVSCRADASLDGTLLWWITRLADLEQSLESERQRARTLENIIDLLPVAVFAKDVNNELRYVLHNRKTREIFGLLDAEVLGRKDEEINGPLKTDYLLREDLEIIRQGGSFSMPEQLVELATGEHLYISTRKVLLKDREGKPSLIVGVCEDITEMVEAEAALRLSEKRFRALVSNSPVGIYLTDANGACMYVNEQWQKCTGLSNEEAAGHGWMKGVHPEDLDRVGRAWRSYTNMDEEKIADSPVSQEFRFVRPDGRVTWVLASIVAFKNENNQVLGYLGSLSDITRHKKHEMELQISRDEAARANAAKSSFLSRMSHELRTPLNAVLGFSQLLQMSGDNLTAKQVEGVGHIYSAGEQLLHLIEDVLDFSRADGGSMNISIHSVSVDKVVRDSLSQVASLAEQYGVRVLAAPESGMCAFTDMMCLQKILVHLLTNAIKYNQDYGEVEVVVDSREAGQLRISVIDTGPGIPPEHQALLFEPFERITGTEKQVEGTGIGLSICRKLAELTGSRLGYSSEVGSGSTFWLDVPAVVVEGESIEAADRSEIMGPLACLVGTQILYVEENLANIGFLVKLAQHIPDCRIIAATNALEGLALAKSAQPDLILLGMHMHGLDGFSALELLREDEKVMHIPVIALSPVAAPETIQKAYAAGFADFLTTPLQRDDFVGAVANALGNTRRSESQGKGASLSNQ